MDFTNYVDRKKSGIATIVNLNGKICLKRKIFDPATGIQSGEMVDETSITQLKEMRQVLQERIIQIDAMIADASLL